MERAFFTLSLNPGFEEEYDRAHQAVWPSVLAALEGSGISAFSIFRDGTSVYFYMESRDFRASMDVLNSNAEHTRWNQAHSHFFVSAVGPTSGDAGFALVPEVFRFEGAGGAGGE